MNWLNASCVNGTICFELVKGVPAGLVALAIGIPTIFIARRQYLLAKAKLNLDLFDKRFKVYTTTVDIFRLAIGGNIAQKNANPLYATKAEARFLFGKDIEDYLVEGINYWTALKRIDENAAGNVGEVRAKELAERDQIVAWFLKQILYSQDKFGKYMNFEKWR